MFRKVFAQTLVALAFAAAADAGRAEWRALLVGVADYPTLPAGVERTTGARNDVLLLREVLRQRGLEPEQIRVLSDGVAGAELPTRANILRALDDLAAASAPGDSVFVHFSGHGSLEPGAAARGEGTPTFLPLNIGRWNGAAGVVENAIRQGDLRQRVDRIANRGAFVWGVFDACHSAVLVRRPGSPQLQRRFVDPAALGVPLGAIEGWREGVEAGGGAAAGTAGAAAVLGQAPVLRGVAAPRAAGARHRGGTVFFYAAQAGESAVELKLPLGTAASRSHGLFSFMVAQILRDARPMTYRQLAQAVLAGYGTIPAAYSTPTFTGDALDRLVLGQDSLPVRQWPLVPGGEWSIEAGLLAGLVPGTVLAIVPRPTAGDGEQIGHLRVVSAEPGRATLAPVTSGALAPSTMPNRASLAPGHYARLLRSPPRYTLRVAQAVQGCAVDCPAAAALRRLREAGVGGVEGVDLQWVPVGSAEPADVVVRQRAGRIELLAPTSVAAVTVAEAPGAHPASRASQATSLTRNAEQSPETLAARLAERLRALARTRNLLALATHTLMESPAEGLVATLSRAGAGRTGPTGPAGDEPITPERTMRVWHGDVLSLAVENRGPVALDVTVLYLDGDHGIAALFPRENGETNRIAPGGSRRIDDLRINVPPGGLERIVVIAQPARPGAERADYSFLAQSTPSPSSARAAPPPQAEAFADAVFADYRRRGSEQPAMPGGHMGFKVFTLDVRASR